jgi:hypothetical protein
MMAIGVSLGRRGFDQAVLLGPSLPRRGPQQADVVTGSGNIHVVERQVEPVRHDRFDAELTAAVNRDDRGNVRSSFVEVHGRFGVAQDD